MFDSLDASGFKGTEPFYDTTFEDLLSKIVRCYHLMISDRVSLENHEEKIRDELLINYLNKDSIRHSIGLTLFIFDREVPEDHTQGRTDIKIRTLNSFFRSAAYYILECKRLENKNLIGKAGLNAEYVKNGICRFTSKQYSSYHRVNGMIGFLVDELDIDQNVEHINRVMKTYFQECTAVEQAIVRSSFIDDFDFHYNSLHTDIDGQKIRLYHLMLDVSQSLSSRSAN